MSPRVGGDYSGKVRQNGTYASQVLGCAGIHTHTPTGEPALRGQHVVRRGAPQRCSLCVRLRHWFPPTRSTTGARVERKPGPSTHFRLALSLGPHSRHTVLRAAL